MSGDARAPEPAKAGPVYGERIFQVRVALGGGSARNAMSLEEFNELIAARTGRRIHVSELSNMERFKRVPLTVDLEAIAAVDPLHRGPAWLMGWDEWPGTAVDDAPRNGPPVPSPSDLKRAPKAPREHRRGA